MVLLVATVTAAAVLLWIVPTSRDFVVRAVLIGAFGGIVVDSALKDYGRNNRVLVFYILLVLLVGGYYWSRDHSFGVKQTTLTVSRLVIDYIVAALAAFFVSTTAVRYFYFRTIKEDLFF